MALRVHAIAVALSTAALAGAVQAQSVTFTDMQPLSDVEISGVLSVPTFDPSLGTLTGVSWSVTGAIASILGVQNDGPRTIVGSAFTSVDFDVDAPGLNLGASPDFNVFGTTGLVTLSAGESALFPVTASTTLSGTEAPGAAFLLPGTIDLGYLTTTSFGGSGFGGDITISQATDAGLSFSVTYEYRTTPVPELPTTVLAALGLAGIGLTRMRQRGARSSAVQG